MIWTRVEANITRHETVVYEFEGYTDPLAVVGMIQSGEYEPVSSEIHHEEVEIVELRSR